MASLKRSADEVDSSNDSVSKQPRLEEPKNTVISVGIKKGERSEMQDRHSIQMQLNCGVENIERSILVSLFDGHAGSKCSEFCNQNFHRIFSNMCQKYSNKCQEQLEKSMKKTFMESYKTIDDGFLAEARKNKPAWKDGSTGTTIFMLKNTIYSAHIGDTHAFLCRRKAENELLPMQLTTDHSAINVEERARIAQKGGSVSNGRLLGILEVSRAFGDGQLKAHGLISEPSIKKLTITDSDLFMICGTDGLWKVFKPLEAINYVYKKLTAEQNLERAFHSIADSLAAEAILRGSGDNVSVVIIGLTKNLKKL